MFDHVLFGTKGTHFGEYTVLGQISNNKNIVHNNGWFRKPPKS